MCHGMLIPRPKEWPRGGCLVCKGAWTCGWEFEVQCGWKGIRSEERKGKVCGPETRAVCSIMFGHRQNFYESENFNFKLLGLSHSSEGVFVKVDR